MKEKMKEEKDLSGMTDDELRAYFAAEDAGLIDFEDILESLPPLPPLPTAEDEVVAIFVPTKPKPE
jgi:hypothetical protein